MDPGTSGRIRPRPDAARTAALAERDSHARPFVAGCRDPGAGSPGQAQPPRPGDRCRQEARRGGRRAVLLQSARTGKPRRRPRRGEPAAGGDRRDPGRAYRICPAEDVPDGPDETAIGCCGGTASRRSSICSASHEAIGERLGLMDFARAGRLSGRALSCCGGRWRGWSGRSPSLCST